MKRPEVRYDPETDALGIVLSDRPSTESYEAAPDIIIAVDENGDAVGIEVLGGAQELFAPLIQHAQQKRRAAS